MSSDDYGIIIEVLKYEKLITVSKTTISCIRHNAGHGLVVEKASASREMHFIDQLRSSFQTRSVGGQAFGMSSGRSLGGATPGIQSML